MRTAIAALVVALAAAAVNAAPAPGQPEVTVTVTDIIDVTTTVWEGEPTPNNNEALAVSSSCTSTTQPAAASSEAPPPPPPPPPPSPAAAAPTTEAPAPAAAATSSAAAPPPPPPPPPPATGGSYAQLVVTHHNIHRQNNSVGALVWNDTLASIAQQIGSSCIYAHNTQAGGGGYGQNIAAGAPPDNITSIISDAFYNGEIGNFAGLYGQATPAGIDSASFDGWGHYTQIVWGGTTDVGCATVDCTSQGLGNVGSDVPPFFTVCNYYPPGNFLGEFANNVLQPGQMPTVTWSYGVTS